jgi:heme-degrading monooxygenase HmoA
MILVAFRSRIRPAFVDEIIAMAAELQALVRSIPGFIEYKEFLAEDGEGLALVLFEDAESLSAWRDNPRHREAMMLGYERWMSSYDISVCEVNRHYTRGDREDAMTRGKFPGVVLDEKKPG